jgi:hypothetical protein
MMPPLTKGAEEIWAHGTLNDLSNDKDSDHPQWEVSEFEPKKNHLIPKANIGDNFYK